MLEPDRDLEPLYAEHLRVQGDRLAGALAAAGLDGLSVFAGPERFPARDDQPYPFKAEPYFEAWVPLARAAGSIIELVPGERPRLIYVQSEDFWYEPPADPAGFWTRFFDIEIVGSDAEALQALGNGRRRRGAIGETGSAAARFASVNDASLLAHLDYFRAFKTGYEVACMEIASRIAVRGHDAAAEAFAAGASEFEIHQRYCTVSGQRETELPYPAIVALDGHASILHYQNLRHARPKGASLLLDAGARYLGYASDVTRTHARHSGDFGDLIASMESLQQTLCRELRAGVDFVALHGRAHELLAQVLATHGLVKCGADEALARGLTRTFLPHGLGHLLGLQVHDAGGRQVSPDGTLRPPPAEHPFLRLTRVVEPGFVVTIEPGLYFIPSLLRTMAAADRQRVDWAAVDRLLPYGGIRVEDDVLVEGEGIRNLTRDAFAAVARGDEDRA